MQRRSLSYYDTPYSGRLRVDETKPSFTFKYRTDKPATSNWIGIYYAYGGGPDNGAHVQDSLTWNWAPAADGSVTVSPYRLQAGTYKAYFLAAGGYQSLAEPVIVNLGDASDLQLFANSFTTHNAREGDRFTANVANLVNRAGDPRTRYSRERDDNEESSWAKLDAHGIISGTPPVGTGDTTVRVRIENNDPAKAVTLPVRIPVRQRGTPLIKRLRVLSFNLWLGGRPVEAYHAKQLRFLTDADLDVVGLQESDGGHGIRLARALGWYSWQGPDCSIITRYPIAEVIAGAPDKSGAVRISPDDGHGSRSRDFIFWNCHLGYDPYGPYDFCFDRMTRDQVLQREAQSGRTGQIMAIMARMAPHLAAADDVPVILVGDFNAPSHLDWTDATESQHCGVGSFDWPTSKVPVDSGGLSDSYRVYYPDPVRQPGITWSPIFLENQGRPEPLDRIDFIYHKGKKLTVSESEAVVVGQPTPEPNHANNEWTSDHKAVLTVYSIKS